MKLYAVTVFIENSQLEPINEYTLGIFDSISNARYIAVTWQEQSKEKHPEYRYLFLIDIYELNKPCELCVADNALPLGVEELEKKLSENYICSQTGRPCSACEIKGCNFQIDKSSINP